MTAPVAAHPSLAVTYWRGWLQAHPAWVVTFAAAILIVLFIAAVVRFVPGADKTPRRRAAIRPAARVTRAARRMATVVRRLRGATTGWGRDRRPLAPWEMRAWARILGAARNVPGREPPGPPAGPETAGGSAPAGAAAEEAHPAGDLVTHQDTWLWEGHPRPAAYSDDTGEFTRFIEAGETS